MYTTSTGGLFAALAPREAGPGAEDPIAAFEGAMMTSRIYGGRLQVGSRFEALGYLDLSDGTRVEHRQELALHEVPIDGSDARLALIAGQGVSFANDWRESRLIVSAGAGLRFDIPVPPSPTLLRLSATGGPALLVEREGVSGTGAGAVHFAVMPF
jgi:hypothetical protein